MGVVAQLLQNLGLSEDEIKAIEANSNDVKVDGVGNKIVDTITARIVENQDFYKSIPYQKLTGTDAFNDILKIGYNKAVGIHGKAFNEAFDTEAIDSSLSDEEKKPENYYKKIAEAYKTKHSKLKMDEVAKNMESENENLRKKVKEIEESSIKSVKELKTLHAQELSNIGQRYEAQTLLMPYANNIRFGLSGSLNEVIENVAKKYALIGAPGAYELRNKENTEFKAKDSEGNTLTYEKALINEIKQFNAWIEQKETPKPQPVRVAVNGFDEPAPLNATGLSQNEIDALIEKHK